MTQRRRAATRLGVLCIVAGLVVLGYVGWQLIGTNILSERRQERLVEELRDDWNDPATAGVTAGGAGLGDATALVRIPRFGDDYVMPVLEGVDDENLASGFAHFTTSADLGAEGNYALAGHRITHGEPLRALPDLQPGDEVLVEDREAVYTYVIDTDPEDLVVTASDTWVVDAHPVNPDPGGVQPADDPRLLTLTTCAELFHTDERMVVFGHLTAATRK